MAYYNCSRVGGRVKLPDSFTITLTASSSTNISFKLAVGETIWNTVTCGGNGSVDIGGVKYNYSGSVSQTTQNAYPENIPFSGSKSFNITFKKK